MPKIGATEMFLVKKRVVCWHTEWDWLLLDIELLATLSNRANGLKESTHFFIRNFSDLDRALIRLLWLTAAHIQPGFLC